MKLNSCDETFCHDFPRNQPQGLIFVSKILQIAKTMTVKWLALKQQQQRRRQHKQKIMSRKIQIVTALVHIHQVSVRNEARGQPSLSR